MTEEGVYYNVHPPPSPLPQPSIDELVCMKQHQDQA